MEVLQGLTNENLSVQFNESHVHESTFYLIKKGAHGGSPFQTKIMDINVMGFDEVSEYTIASFQFDLASYAGGQKTISLNPLKPSKFCQGLQLNCTAEIQKKHDNDQDAQVEP